VTSVTHPTYLTHPTRLRSPDVSSELRRGKPATCPTCLACATRATRRHRFTTPMFTIVSPFFSDGTARMNITIPSSVAVISCSGRFT